MPSRHLYLLALFTLVLSSCGGGGGGSRSSNDATANQSNNLSTPIEIQDRSIDLQWQAPELRSDGQHLEPSGIAGYYVIYLEKDEIRPVQGTAGGEIGSFERFSQADEQLGNFFDGKDAKRFLVQGSRNLLTMPPTPLRFSIERLSPGTYYIAMGTCDYYGNFSKLSETIKVVLEPKDE